MTPKPIKGKGSRNTYYSNNLTKRIILCLDKSLRRLLNFEDEPVMRGRLCYFPGSDGEIVFFGALHVKVFGGLLYFLLVN
jgi:hypothetical protein